MKNNINNYAMHNILIANNWSLFYWYALFYLLNSLIIQSIKFIIILDDINIKNTPLSQQKTK